MKVTLLHNTPLWVAEKAIRKCWASEDKSDSQPIIHCDKCSYEGIGENEIGEEEQTGRICPYCGHLCSILEIIDFKIGQKGIELIDRVANKNKHSSTIEHLVYTFDIDGISRALLQELARHRMASLSVKSTRYTLKELKDELLAIKPAENWYSANFDKYLVKTSNEDVNRYNRSMLMALQERLRENVSNDIVKYMLPEAYKTSLVWTINARSLQNFLKLRSDKSALWEIRDLAKAIYNELPDDHKFLFREFMYER